MLNVKLVLISVLLFVTATTHAGAAAATPTPGSELKGYREWKSDKIQAVINRITSTKALVTIAKTEANVKNAQNFERQLAQEQWNLEVAKDLSVTDYFLLYLTQQNHRDRFYRAATKLNSAEVAELMEAYSKELGGSASESGPSVNIAPQATSQAGKGL